MRRSILATALATAALTMSFLMAGCGARESAEQRKKEADSVAGKTGKVAYSVAKESGKVAKVAEKKLAEAAHQAHEGWKEAAAKDKK